MSDDGLQMFQRPASAHQPLRVVATPHDSPEQAQATGEFVLVDAETLVDRREWR